jgi:hypothetical protein
MVVKEFFRQRKDGVNLYKTYSDANFYIQKVNTDEIYRCAIDVENVAFEYVETDKIIEDKSEKRNIIKNNKE